MSDGLGLYIHIPFCTRKCGYCSFYSVLPNGKLISDYLDALCTEISFYRGTSRVVDSVYFGGGTPNILGFREFARIFEAIKKAFDLLPGAEVTVEMNPNLVTPEGLENLKMLGVNRASVGVQSFEDRDLKFLGRRHSAEGAKKAVELAKKAFGNVSVDLILGLPLQTKKQYSQAASQARSLGVKHVSGYLLKVESQTEFYDRRVRSLLPTEDETAQQYEEFVEQLEKHDFRQYEISNFSRPEFESVHNLKYWQCKEYVGVGVSAHSYFGQRRYYVASDIAAYIANARNADQRLRQKKGALPPHLQARVEGVIKSGEGQIYYEEPCDLFSETVMLGLRLNRGVLLKELKKIDEKRCNRLLSKLDMSILKPYIISDGERLCLTTRGFLVSNYIIANLLY